MNPQKERVQYSFVDERIRGVDFERHGSLPRPEEPAKLKQARQLVKQYDIELSNLERLENEARNRARNNARLRLKEFSFMLSYEDIMKAVHRVQGLFLRHQEHFVLSKQNEPIDVVIEQYFNKIREGLKK
jgi:hypothetical protein